MGAKKKKKKRSTSMISKRKINQRSHCVPLASESSIMFLSCSLTCFLDLCWWKGGEGGSLGKKSEHQRGLIKKNAFVFLSLERWWSLSREVTQELFSWNA